jgi:sugar lactone lactonase YvrE
MVPTARFVPGARLFPRTRPNFCHMILVGLLLPAAAQAQVSYTGTAANQNFGSQAIGSTSTTKTLSFSIAAGTTVGSVGVVTQGAPNLDFANAAGGTCTATTYTSTITCTVKVTFTPKYAGLRMGAVVFFSAAGNKGIVLGEVPIYGTGTGPQIAFNPSPVIAIDPVANGTGLSAPQGALVDAAGDMFIPDYSNRRVVELPAGGGTPIVISPTVNGVGLSGAIGVALDGAGDLFIVDRNNQRVVEVPIGGGAPTAIDPTVNGEGLNQPICLTMDGAGDLYIGDSANNRVVVVPAGGGTPTTISATVNGEGLNGVQDMALDGAGNLFITDSGNNRVVEVPAGGGAATAIDPTVNGVSFSDPDTLTVDVNGDLFISDHGNDRVVEIPARGGQPIAIDPVVNGKGLAGGALLTLDGAGDLFIGDPSNNRVVEVQRSQPLTLNFPTPTNVGSTDTTDGTLTAQVQNIGNQALTLTALSYPADFPEASGDANACTGTTSLSAGLMCDLPIEFTPETDGPLGANVTLTDNALNVSGAQQSIAVSGLGVSATSATHFSITTTATAYAFIPFTITVTALNSSNQTATSYGGTVSFTSSDPGFVNPGPLTLSSGVRQATVTLETTGTQTIKATDTTTSALSGSGSFPVMGSATRFLVRTAVPVAAGTPFSITVTAFTSTSQTATNYNGTVSFTSSDPGFVNPGPLTLSSGVGQATVTLKTIGNQTITATDTFTPSLTGTGSFGVASVPPPPPPVTYTGTAANQSFGSQAVGSTSAANTFSFSVAAGTTVGSIGVVTQGAPSLDFANATGSTCTATTYTSASTCTVNVTFTPKGVGVLMGAVVFFSGPNNSGTVVGSLPVHGVGTGPLLAFGFGQPVVIAFGGYGPDVGYGGIYAPTGLATDAAGDVFINDCCDVLELLAGGGSVTAASVSGTGGLAVDGAGNLFIVGVGGSYRGAVVEVPVGGGAYSAIYPVVSNIGLSGATGVTVDATGDLFIADTGNNRVVEVPARGRAAVAIAPAVGGTGLSGPTDVKLDAAGDLFIADQGNNRVVEVPAGGGAAIAIAGVGTPYALALDVLSDLFVLGYTSASVEEVPAGGGAPFQAVSIWDSITQPDYCTALGFIDSAGIATDSAGDLFVSTFSLWSYYDPTGNPQNVVDYYSYVCEFPRSQPPTLNFPTATNVGSIDTTDGTQTVQIQNLGNQALNLAALSYPADFPQASGDPNPCPVSISLSAGQSCDIPIEFAPKRVGALSEDATFTENSLNVTGTKQSIILSGTGVDVQEVLTSPTPGSTLAGSSTTFTWTAGTGATEYNLWLGLNGAGSSDLYNSGVTTATSANVTNLPTAGATIHARLFWLIGTGWHSIDYTYTEATAVLAAMTSPTAGTTLGSSNIHFTWTAGVGVTSYNLWLGLNGVGSSNLYNSGVTTATSVIVPVLPAKGGTIYARLFSDVGGRWESTDYTYTAATGGLAAITSPSPGATLGTSNVTFTWTAGVGVTHYNLWVGLNGVGSSDLYNSGSITNTTTTVPKLPASGATLHVRLYSDVGGEWESTDYTYTEQ